MGEGLADVRARALGGGGGETEHVRGQGEAKEVEDR